MGKLSISGWAHGEGKKTFNSQKQNIPLMPRNANRLQIFLFNFSRPPHAPPSEQH